MSALYPYLKIEIYSNSFKNMGMLAVDTKNPAKSMNGMISTGVSVTASYLSEKLQEMIKEYPLLAL